MSEFRAIRPDPLQETPILLTHLSSGGDSAASEGSRSQTRKKVSFACKACKQRKAKCSGNHPCERCVAKSQECVFAEESDGRKTTQLNRKAREFERDSDLLRQLLETIRGSQDSGVAKIVSLIRCNASLDEIRLGVQRQMNDASQSGQRISPEIDSLGHELDDLRKLKTQRSESGFHTTSQRYSKLGVARLADSPPHTVPASPWTVVTDDDSLVSHLISVWVTWDKPLYILSTKDTSFVTCKERGSVSKLMEDFMNEAKRLLEEEAGKPSLTTVQGLGCLYMAVCATGEDRVGYHYMKQAISMCEDLLSVGIYGKETYQAYQNQTELSEAIDYTCWGIFNITTLACLAWMRPQLMKAPSRPKPQIPSLMKEIKDWTPYAQQGPEIPSYSRELMRYHCELSAISQEIGHALFRKDHETPVLRKAFEKVILSFYERILSWHSSVLQDRLMPEKDSPPSMFLLQCYYQTIVLTSLGALKESCEEASESVVDYAKTIYREAAVEVARLLRLYQKSWGSEHTNIFFIQPITLSLYTFMDEPNCSSEYSKEITDLCGIFRAISRRWPFGMNVFRMVQLNTKQRGIRLPPETDLLFEEFETQDWLEQETKRVVSIYPDAASATFKK